MHIVVCVKQIPNPEIAQSLFRVDEAAKKVVPVAGLAMVISPFDEQAVEAALRIRDKGGEVKITVLSLGADSAKAVIKGALALGADEGVLLCDPAFEDSDSYATAVVLAQAIRKIGSVDLILTGRQAADWDAGIVGCGLAELLDMPAVTFGKDVKVNGNMVRVERVLADGFETVEAPLPAVVTVAHELGKPRYASLRETMKAARKPITTWTAKDLGLEAGQVGAAGARRTLERLYIPVNDVRCEFIKGGSPEETAAVLARRLHEARLI
jgi:electron transfer flavoprotein beta subunit